MRIPSQSYSSGFLMLALKGVRGAGQNAANFDDETIPSDC